MKHRIIFFGTPEFAVPTLQALVKAGYEVVAVVTQPDKPVGRGLKMEAPAVKLKAQELGLLVLQPTTLRYSEVRPPDARRSDLPISDQLKTLNPDLGIAVAYGKIIPKEILDIFPRGILNVHPSLLPKYRGPSPIQSALLNGDTETGITIMLLDEEMDHGPIVASSVQRLASRATGGELSAVLAQLGARLLIDALPKWLAGKITPKPQDHARATFTKLLEREDGKIDWKKPAEYIEHMVCAYDLWPGTWTMWAAHPDRGRDQSGKRIKILRVSLLHHTIGCATDARPGYVCKTDDGRVAVNCNPGALVLEALQLEGTKQMSGPAFLNGHPRFLGSVLEF